MTQLYTTLALHGFTRDDATWLVGKLVAIAALIATGVFDVNKWAAFLGIHLTDTQVHWVWAVAVAIGWFSSQVSTSQLPGKAK